MPATTGLHPAQAMQRNRIRFFTILSFASHRWQALRPQAGHLRLTFFVLVDRMPCGLRSPATLDESAAAQLPAAILPPTHSASPS